ncbi:unannotated protein [freshwater metagenome]|uniref:Unannotated protein n=1 Tax=freshwater metagenome TaxID=449393 RepID=A0A6J6YK98_9ZZZZ
MSDQFDPSVMVALTLTPIEPPIVTVPVPENDPSLFLATVIDVIATLSPS